HRFPVDPSCYHGILECALELMPREAPAAREELRAIAGAFGHLPVRVESAPEKRAERNRDKEAYKARLAALAVAEPAGAAGAAAAVRAVNTTPGERGGSDTLHKLLEAQAYRLAYWRVASDQINYRRFFDINDLAALRMEDEAVFEATHRLVLGLVA